MEPIRSALLRRKSSGFTQHYRNSAGFTLIELMVVLTIIAVITSVAVTSQGQFNKSLVLTNAAYDLALTIRSAETFGLGSRAYGATVNAGYGLHFASGETGAFTLFADTSPSASCSTPNCNAGDDIYTSGSDSFVQSYTLGNGIFIQNFCAFASGAWSCSLSWLDIVFERPNPNAHITAKSGSSPFTATSACIVLASPQGGAKYIFIGTSGQIITNASASSCGL